MDKECLNNIAIIDYVGQKGGMHDYSIQLLDAIKKDLNVQVYYYSNIRVYPNSKVKILKIFNPNIRKNLKGLINFIGANIRAAIECRKNYVSWVIIHLFEFSLLVTIFLLILNFFNLKVIAIVHDVESFEKNDWKWNKSFILNRLVKKIVVHNNYSKKILIESGLDNNINVNVIAHGNFIGLNNNNLPHQSFMDVLTEFSNEKFILFFGQIKAVKGLDILLKALPLTNSKIKLVIAGKTWKDETEKYTRLINDLNLNERVLFINRFISDEERDYLFKKARFIVLPYKKIYQSGVMLMAMSKRLFVLASDLPANKELLQNGIYGELFKSEDYEDLAYQINKNYFDKERIKIMVEKSYHFIQAKYCWRLAANSYKNMIKT